MKNFGIMLIVVGVIWGIFAFNMETSIITEGKTIGAGLYSTYIPSQTVHNLDLASRRQNHLIGAGVLFISGIILFGFGSIKASKEAPTQDSEPTYRKTPIRRRELTDGRCPFSEEVVSNTELECTKCGQTLTI